MQTTLDTVGVDDDQKREKKLVEIDVGEMYCEFAVDGENVVEKKVEGK